ncbi:MAG: hypothetical protein AABX01_05585 [Candidatus Micrarchaeota archaeon]
MRGIFLFILLTGYASAFQQVAGPVVIGAEIGGEAVGKHILINDENQTISVGISAEGEAAKFLEFEKRINIAPFSSFELQVEANLKNYAGAAGKQLEGFITATKEGGDGGAVSIALALRKQVIIKPLAKPPPSPSPSPTQIIQIVVTSPPTAEKPFQFDNFALAILSLVIIVIAVIRFSSRK